MLFNRAELTLRCLQSITVTSGDIPIEVILVDNASTDRTSTLLDRVSGATVVRLKENLGYLQGCNRGAHQATGTHVLMLNSDTELTPGALARAVETLEADTSVGAVGGKLILPDGSLQEAGSIIWRDGGCTGYGRGDDPDAPHCMFVRDVDFCSAAFLLTPRLLFHRLGGFDETFAPAYYEDADYCMRLWQAGFRVLYQPRVNINHYEFGSSGTAGAIELQTRNRAAFVSRHADWLRTRPPFASSAILKARAHTEARRLLLFDDWVPHEVLGSGFPRALALIRTLLTLGWQVAGLTRCRFSMNRGTRCMTSCRRPLK